MSKDHSYPNREKSVPTEPNDQIHISTKTDPKTLQFNVLDIQPLQRACNLGVCYI